MTQAQYDLLYDMALQGMINAIGSDADISYSVNMNVYDNTPFTQTAIVKIEAIKQVFNDEVANIPPVDE